MRATPRAWHFLAIAAGFSVLLVGSYVFFVHGYMGQLLDEQARAGARFGGTRIAAILDTVPMLSAGLVVVATAVGLLRRRVLATGVALGVVVAANLTSQLLKHEVLTRPDNGATGTWHNSFPSGHTTVFASAMFALFLVSAPRLRPFVAAIGAIATVTVGAMLVGSQWHRPSDVVGGVLVVAIYVFLAGAVLARWTEGGAPRRRRGSGGVVALLAVAALVSAAAFALAYVTADASVDGVPAAAVAGLVAITAAAGGSALLATRLFRTIA